MPVKSPMSWGRLSIAAARTSSATPKPGSLPRPGPASAGPEHGQLRGVKNELVGHDPIADIATRKDKGSMVDLINQLSKLPRRWSSQQETTLHLEERETMDRRLAGDGKSDRADAKFLLLAMVPSMPMILSDYLVWK